MAKKKQDTKSRLIKVIHHSPTHVEFIFEYDEDEPKPAPEPQAPTPKDAQQLPLDLGA